MKIEIHKSSSIYRPHASESFAVFGPQFWPFPVEVLFPRTKGSRGETKWLVIWLKLEVTGNGTAKGLERNLPIIVKTKNMPVLDQEFVQRGVHDLRVVRYTTSWKDVPVAGHSMEN